MRVVESQRCKKTKGKGKRATVMMQTVMSPLFGVGAGVRVAGKISAHSKCCGHGALLLLHVLLSNRRHSASWQPFLLSALNVCCSKTVALDCAQLPAQHMND